MTTTTEATLQLAAQRVATAQQKIPPTDHPALKDLEKSVLYYGWAAISAMTGDEEAFVEYANMAETWAHSALVKAGYPDPFGTAAVNAGHEGEYA